MKKFISIGLISLVIFFAASLMGLADVAPRDFSPEYKREVAAVGRLRQHGLVLLKSPAIELSPGDGEEKTCLKDDETVKTLAGLIKEFSSASARIDPRRVIGVGYSSIRLPLGGESVDALKPVYVMLAPEKGDSSEYVTVGDLKDLGQWLSGKHQRSRTATLFVLVTTGFMLQLSENLRLAVRQRPGQAA
jgi:hypothetical protein